MKISLLSICARHPAATAHAPDAVRGVSLNVESGEHIAIIGPSGAGKTTILHLLACALQPSAGSLLLEAVNPWEQTSSVLQTLRGKLFLAPQVPPLPPRQRVGLARILASNAKLLLVDEPLSALDPLRSEQAIETLTHIAT